MAWSFWKLFGLEDSAPVQCTSRLQPVELLRRIEQACKAKPVGWFSSGYRLRLKGPERFVLSYVRGRNSFRRDLHARVMPTSSGCELDGVFRVSRLVRGFILMWFSIAGLITGVALADAGLSVWPVALFPLIGVLLPRLGRAFAINDEARVIALVSKAAEDAHEPV